METFPSSQPDSRPPHTPTDRSADAPGAALRAELVDRFRLGAATPWSDAVFADLALRVFEFQYHSVPVYRALCDARGITPDVLERWEDIPAVPTAAFKTFDLCTIHRPAERVFLTSGTTAGHDTRGRHHVADLGLYDASLLPNARAHLLHDATPTLVALMPPPAQAPDSSLSYMLGVVRDRLCRPGGGFFVDAGAGLRVPALHETLERLTAGGHPALVAGTAFAFHEWITSAPEWTVRLPGGSCVMDTGGFKGRTRTVSRSDLHAALSARLGVPERRIIGEYGMTELLSQFYEPVLEQPDGERRYRGPGWLRARVLDPVTLTPMPEGAVGILAHTDLANLYSVSTVLTEDLATAVEGGFRLAGRAPGAEPRGCSLLMEELVRVARAFG